MAGKTTFEIDFSSMEWGLKILAELPTSEAVKRTARTVGEEFLEDTLARVPTVPMDTGRLRASGSVLIDGELIATSAKFGYKHPDGTPLQAIGKSELGKDGSEITVVYNTPYAAAVHEMPATTNWTTGGSGAKYIENTLFERGESYMKKWFEAIKSEMGKQRRS